jgi:hypothetical protein
MLAGYIFSAPVISVAKICYRHFLLYEITVASKIIQLRP